MNNIIKENLEKIQDISELKDDWNGNGASAFKDTLIQKMKYLILRLNVQPEIFPTVCGSIQFEYEKETGEYLEFELFDTKLKVLTMGSDGNNYSYDMDIDIEEINKVIPESHKSDFIVTQLPSDLYEALYTFMVANVIRDLRKKNTSHRSMLVNISRFTKVQNQVYENIYLFHYHQ